MCDNHTGWYGALEDGTIYLGSLRPHQREWWVAVDCFHF